MMLKHGKRELREITPAQARKKMKRTLLYTYFTSLACLVLCCAMFLGTTMAWFSDDVVNTGNVIQVGTLKAALYHVEPGKSDEVPTIETLLNENPEHPVFELNAWAPGTSQTQTLMVVNQGDLEFSYDLSLLLVATSPAGTEVPALTVEEQSMLLDSFEVYVYPGNENVPALISENIAEEDAVEGYAVEGKWLYHGTLGSFLSQIQTVEAVEGAEGTQGASSPGIVYQEIPLYSGTLKPNVAIEEGTATTDSVQYVTVAIKMAENSTDSLMGQSFTMSVKLVATQTLADSVQVGDGETENN